MFEFWALQSEEMSDWHLTNMFQTWNPLPRQSCKQFLLWRLQEQVSVLLLAAGLIDRLPGIRTDKALKNGLFATFYHYLSLISQLNQDHQTYSLDLPPPWWMSTVGNQYSYTFSSNCSDLPGDWRYDEFLTSINLSDLYNVEFSVGVILNCGQQYDNPIRIGAGCTPKKGQYIYI